MKRQSLSLLTALLLLVLISASCKKETPENKVPVADAGAPQTITLYTDSVTLTGSGTDADGQVVAYLWSQVSGPSSTTIVNPGNTSTKVKGFKAGSYVFQLMVTDNKGATGVDTCKVTVNPSAITTLTLQPANNPNEFKLINHNGVDESAGPFSDLPVMAWTSGGVPYTGRYLLKFDLSSIPSSATITSANLYLYSYSAPFLNGNFTDANFGTNNTMLVQQVTSSWSPSTTNWFNQPSVTTTNQVTVPHTALSSLDVNLNVTELVKSMVNSSANYGFYLKLQNEVYYQSRIFVGSTTPAYSAKFPKLVVVYQ